MQTLHRLRRFRDLRAVSTGAKPPADGVPSPLPAATDQEARPAVPAAPFGTGPESGAVPRGRQRQRAIRFHLSRDRTWLPDRVCRAALVRQTAGHPGDGRGHAWQHDRPPVGVAACLPVCARACWTGWPADSLPICLPACLFACLAVRAPLPVAGSVGRGYGQLPPLGQDDQTQRRAVRHGGGGLSVGLCHRVRPGGAYARLHRQARGRGLLYSRPR